MTHADLAYYTQRAEQEQARAERAPTLVARNAHRKLRDLYLRQIGHAAGEADLPDYADEHA